MKVKVWVVGDFFNKTTCREKKAASNMTPQNRLSGKDVFRLKAQCRLPKDSSSDTRISSHLPRIYWPVDSKRQVIEFKTTGLRSILPDGKSIQLLSRALPLSFFRNI
ncbi:MAG: hypothetical protein HEQ17_11480 [Limnohabitans sp.]|uniref:hypothetical protein n=1 Tax=Limnohabitans sp. TaxID=1907725 RepID=UPI0025CEDFAE|nr:hypothetical protein [Limnohabitans sp.]MCO4089522.1 hypothetical protein [Limnohabitans sp.]